MSSLEVLLVTPDYPPPPGGIQTVVRNLEHGLTDAGHCVEVSHVDPQSYVPVLKDYLPRPQWLYSVRALVTLQFPYQSVVYRAVAEKIDNFQPDIVHALHIRTWGGLVAASERGVPTVLTAHALELEERALAQRAIGAADIVQPVSEFTASLVSDINSTAETRVIHPSIDVDAYRQVAERVDDGSADGPVVTIARLVERKNVGILVEAWELLDDSITDGRELVIVGDGPERDAIESLAMDRNDVRFTGWIDEERKRELLACASAFALIPRRIRFDVEGFGIVYLEAQAAGTSVIGSNCGGVPEAIGDAGIIVDDEDDPDEVADAIETILTDEETRKMYEQNAADRINRFDIPPITEEYISLYEDLVN